MSDEELIEKFRTTISALSDIDDMLQEIITDKNISYEIYNQIECLIYKISKTANDQGLLLYSDDV